jgi:hypothetical protein
MYLYIHVGTSKESSFWVCNHNDRPVLPRLQNNTVHTVLSVQLGLHTVSGSLQKLLNFITRKP